MIGIFNFEWLNHSVTILSLYMCMNYMICRIYLFICLEFICLLFTEQSGEFVALKKVSLRNPEEGIPINTLRYCLFYLPFVLFFM